MKTDTKRPTYSNSVDPVVCEINAAVYRIFRPKWDQAGRCWMYGKLYFGCDRMIAMLRPYGNPTWILDGMTPVGVGFVLSELKGHGVDVSAWEAEFKRREQVNYDADKKIARARITASAKLTPMERMACGL